MSLELRRLWSWVAVCLLVVGTATQVVSADDDTEDPLGDCTPNLEGKGGRCGHAAAMLGRYLREQSSEYGPLDAVGDTDFTHCHLEIEIDPVAKVITGSNTIDVKVQVSSLAQLTLDFYATMIVDSVTVGGTSVTFARPGNTVLITLDRTYAQGETFQVRVAYHGTPYNMGWGSFDFGTHGSSVAMTSTLSEPWGAHTWWPCKEELADKFTADIWITAPDWMTVASNGVLEGTDTLTGSRKRFRWHEGYPIDVYLVSIAATNYTKLTYTYTYAGGSMPVEFYLYPEDVSAIQPYLANVVTGIATFSQPGVYGQYPFVNEKYGIAEFNWGGGMEHQTITSEGGGAMQADWLNMHELSHQWWGDMITCKTWHDIWLNESFATYSEAVFEEKKPGGSATAYMNRLQSRRPAESKFGGTVYCYDISSMGRVFDGDLSYNKGGWVLHMLRHVMGDTAFWNTLAAYRAAFEGGVADTEEFRAVCESVSGRDLSWFFNEWIYNGGVPYYQYGWQQQLIGSQRWVRLHVDQVQDVTYGYPLFTMPIDIVITTAGGTTTQTIWNTAVGRQWFLLPVSANVTAVAFDPDRWLLRGSRVNETYVNGPPKLIDTTPDAGAVIEPYPGVSAVQVQFSEAVLCSAADFSVTGSRTGAQTFSFAYSPNNYLATLTFPRVLPGAQTWTVNVADSVRSQAASVALDGELATPPTLPSGDGLPGGAAVFSFTLGAGAVPADLDHDADVDGNDVLAFAACLSGPSVTSLPAGCSQERFTASDLDHDGDVDLSDFGLLQRCYRGMDVPVNPSCGG